MGADETSSAETRDQAADLRDEAAEARDEAARDRDAVAEERDLEARARDERTLENQSAESDRLTDARLRDDRAAAEADRRRAVDDRQATHAFLRRLHEYQIAIAEDRRAAAEDRRAAAADRRAAAHDRELAVWARHQAAIEAAQMTSSELTHAANVAPPTIDAGQAASTAAELALARRVGMDTQRLAVQSARQAARLAGDVARSEEDVAATLRNLAAHGDAAASDRRLGLADAAITGMHSATEHSDRLRALAERGSNVLILTALHSLLSHARATCAALSETEQIIAGAYEALAARTTQETAAEYRRRVEAANAAALVAAARAQELAQWQLTTARLGSEASDERQEQPAQDE